MADARETDWVVLKAARKDGRLAEKTVNESELLMVEKLAANSGLPKETVSAFH
jgi:hypothetical protein